MIIKSGVLRVIICFYISFFVLFGTSLNIFAQTWDWRQAQILTKEKEEALEIIDFVRTSVKVREKRLEDEAKKGDNFFYGTIVTNPDIAKDVEKQRIALLARVERWEKLNKEDILKIKAKELNRFINEATAIGHYYGLDVVKMTKLYETGKDVIRSSMFQLADSTHPDMDYSFERLKKDILSAGQQLLKQGANLAVFGTVGGSSTIETYNKALDKFYGNASDREVEIAEFMAKKQEYRALLFKRVTLNYLRSMLSSGEAIEYCPVKTKKLTYTNLHGQAIPVLGCPDQSLEYLRRYVDAIRELQDAENQNFIAQAQDLLTSQQFAVDLISVIPLVGDAIDIYSLAYNLRAHEDITGHCVSRLGYTLQFLAAALPLVTPRLLDEIAARVPPEWVKKAKDDYLIYWLLNKAEEIEVILNTDARWYAYTGLSKLSAKAGIDFEKSYLLKNMAERWGVKPETFYTFSRTLNNWAHNAKDQQIRFSSEAAVQAVKNAENLFMKNTFDTAVDDLRKVELFQSQHSEAYERAVREIQEVLDLNLLTYQGNRSEILKQGGIGPDKAAAIEKYIADVKAGLIPDMDPEDITLIYRAVNPKAAELMEKFKVETKGMDVKGKSADWGAHNGFIPVDQKFSKLANPNKKLSEADIAKIKKFHKKVQEFLISKGDRAKLYQVDLVLGDHSVKIVRDPKTKKEFTVFFNPNTGEYLDEEHLIIPKGKLDLSQERFIKVLAYPDENDNPVPLVADFDLLAFGFTKKLEVPSSDPLNGYIAPKEKKVVAGTNRYVNEMTEFEGSITWHGAEQYNFYTPGAFEQDEFMPAFDSKLGLIGIKRCDKQCMIQWCETTGRCAAFGFPKTPICEIEDPKMPCIPIDVNRLLKDFYHLKRVKDKLRIFPNEKWGWGQYNPAGGWTMAEFMRGKSNVQRQARIDALTRSSKLDPVNPLVGTLGSKAYGQVKRNTQSRAMEYLGQSWQYATECPAGKQSSDYLEEDVAW